MAQPADRILITGGTGSLGRAIVARAHDERWGAEIAILSRDEAKQASMAERFPWVTFYLGDVQDAVAVERAMRGAGIVIHAAAHKRVPEAERETMACVGANVIGSMVVLREALRSPTVHTILGVSTDKACSPCTAYGFSKAIMERLFISARAEKRCVLTRYGNVLASTGSVVPTLRAQAERGGPITLTDPGMTRFWLTLEDAVDLITVTLTQVSGTILIPRARASTMAVLAEAIAPGVPIEVIGVRDAEKRHEVLLSAHEAPYARFDGGYILLSPLSGAPQGPHTVCPEYRSDTAEQLSAGYLRHLLDSEGPRALP